MAHASEGSPGAVDLLTPAELDRLMGSREAFELKKDSLATTVGILRGAAAGLPHDLLVKRFNYKGFFHFIMRLLFGSRARRLYTISCELAEKGLPVPEPIAYHDLTWKQRNAFYLSSVVDNAMSFANLYLRGHFQSEEIASLLGKAVAELHTAGVVHGDLKWTNILLQDDAGRKTIFFIDLDQTRLYKNPKMSGISRDLSRFYRNGFELGAGGWLDNAFFPQYLAMLTPPARDRLDINTIRERALKDWRRKGSRKKQIPG